MEVRLKEWVCLCMWWHVFCKCIDFLNVHFFFTTRRDNNKTNNHKKGCKFKKKDAKIKNFFFFCYFSSCFVFCRKFVFHFSIVAIKAILFKFIFLLSFSLLSCLFSLKRIFHQFLFPFISFYSLYFDAFFFLFF